MDDFLRRLAPRPSDYGGLPGKITREDDAGNVYDETGRKIFNKFDQTEQPDSWLDTAISTATAPAKLATGLVGSLNPYGQDGWQVPPIISDPAAAFARSGESTGFGEDGQFYLPNVQNPQVAQDTLTQLMTVYGGNALNPLARAPAGSVGMFAGRRAKTADLNALARAEELAGSGASRDAIWNETGWFQGPDKQWRFEIDDSGSKIPFPTQTKVINEGYDSGSTLRGALSHNELFDAYPDLSPTKWNLGRTEGVKAGSYEPDTSGGFNQHFIEASGPTTSDMHSILLHEAQHALQGIEGFAKGAGANTFTQQADAELARNALSWRREMERHKGDLSARDNIVAEEYAAMGAPDWVPPREARDVAMDYGGNPGGQLEEIIKLYGLDRRTTPYSPREMYNRTAGETEARNVQTRMNMSADQRRASPPWTTQDIPDEDQIVRLLSDNRPSLMGSALASQADALPMDQASRLARAAEQGYDTSNVLYRGMDTAPEGNQYRANTGSLGDGVYLTPDPSHAAKFGDDVRENFIRGNVATANDVPPEIYQRGLLTDLLGLEGTQSSRMAEWARTNGYAGFSQPGYQTVVFDPSNIRSVNAAFDPARAGENGLLLSDNKPSLLGSALASGQGEEDLLALLGYR